MELRGRNFYKDGEGNEQFFNTETQFFKMQPSKSQETTNSKMLCEDHQTTFHEIPTNLEKQDEEISRYSPQKFTKVIAEGEYMMGCRNSEGYTFYFQSNMTMLVMVHMKTCECKNCWWISKEPI